MKNGAKRAVLITRLEAEWLARSVRRIVDEVERRKKKDEELGLDTPAHRDALQVLTGDGVDGGLLTRFRGYSDDTQDMFAAPEPEGQVRRLYTPEEGVEPTEAEPVDGEAWSDPEVPMGLAEMALERLEDGQGGYFEDGAGQVYRLLVRGAVTWEFVGARDGDEIEEAVDASAAEQQANGNVDSLDALPWASKAALQLARTESLAAADLAGKGTGKDGRLTKRDVLDLIEAEPEPASSGG
jgi:pyruvate/2-oxoglutarate dehydrogenase complex dihydrolipoamide acyltransferase (E2) component